MSGALALVEPGTLLQLFCGVVSAVCFTVLQIWSAPFRMPSNNFLAFSADTALVLHLLGSLGVQFNAKYDAQAVDPTLLSVVLFAAGTIIIVLTLLPFLAALPRMRRPPALQGEQLLPANETAAAGSSIGPESYSAMAPRVQASSGA